MIHTMHQVNDVIVHDGQVTLTELPFKDGEHVRVLLLPTGSLPRLSIQEVRQRLRGKAVWIGDPTEPIIPTEEWDAFK